MSTILTTIRWLSIFTGALSLFYLGHVWFEFGLGEVFARIYGWYAAILHPIMDLLEPVAAWLLGLLGWSLPTWWKDGSVLYLAAGGAMSRASSWRRSFRHGQLDDPVLLYDTQVLGAPLRAILWPLLWYFDLVRAIASWLDGVELVTVWRHLIHYSYVGTFFVEATKISVGALIFAALNAGLG